MFAISDDRPVPKRAHTKSRRGCKECKKRKVKCDETRPLCGNCQRRWGDIEKCEFEDVENSNPSSKTRSASSPRWQASIRAGAIPIGPKLDTTLVKSGAVDLQALRGAFPPASPLMKTISGHRLDPFGTHPHSDANYVDILMKHYLSTVVFQSFPWQPQSEKNPVTKYYAPIVCADPVMFHATLQLSAVRLQSRASGFHIASRRLMGECIRLLNARVRDPQLHASDQTIGAVATLAIVEYEKGNIRMFNMHLSGLKQILNLRGGLATVRHSSPMLALMVFWTFIIALTESPTLQLGDTPPPLILPSQTPPWLHSARQTSNTSNAPHLDLPACGVSPFIAVMMDDVNSLSQKFVRSTDYVSAEECLSALGYVCDTLWIALGMPSFLDNPISTSVPTPSPLNPSGSRPVSALLSEASRLALALHIMTPWRGLQPDPALVINDLVHRLKRCLGPMISASSSLPAPYDTVTSPGTTNSSSDQKELLLWLLFTGGVSALGTPLRAWFAKHLVSVMNDLSEARESLPEPPELGAEGEADEQSEWDQMRARLKKVIWHQTLCERSYRLLWREVRAWREDLEGL